MALTFGKLTFLVGAGILTSVLAKEGRLSSVSDAVGGTLKIVSKLIKQDDPGPSDRKLFNDLLAEVSSVQQELSHVPRSVIIETSSGSGTGAKKYGVIVVIVAVGYGYVWWKAAQRQLSSKITSVDRDVNKIVEISQATQEEVTILRGRSKLIGDEFQSVRDIVQTLESKLIEIEGKQDITTLGVKKLCDRARELENGRPTELASRYTLSRTMLELPGITPSSRSGSLHPLPLEPPSPSDSNGSHKGGYWHVQLPMVGTVCTISSVCQLAHSNHVGQAWHTSNDLLAGLSWAGLYWKLSGFMLCAGLPGLVYTTSLQSSDSIIGLVVYNLALLQDINNILILGILPCNETMIYQSNLDVDRQNSVSASGLKEFNGVTKLGESSRSPKVSNGIGASEDLGSWSSSNGVPGRRFSGLVLTRQRSATNGLAQQVLSSGQQC
ncbi:DUF1664 domain-containing protein [Citrus sinensis]|uniref:DUF1664 domain-containing protein n=1 Tax=Citrus sinensis TaxID=2711 RepID=A0ACB8LGG5_CITSI|nr:DUF1664 domain-containing protein [Citrus sinensis]